MTEQLEEALRHTLDDAATRAPVPPADLLSRVESGHDKRRKVRLAVNTGGITAVCAAVLGVMLVVQSISETAPSKAVAEPAASSQQPVSTPPPPANSVPIEKLWPKAVHRISNRLPDRRKFRPVALADERTLLITVESSFEKASELLAHDLKTKATRKITNVVTPAKATGFASHFTVGDGQVIWSTAVKGITQIWTAPVSGGPTVKVTEAPGNPDYFAVADGKVFWSLGDGSGLLQAPLTGGTATPVPGTAQEHILQWPWVASPSRKFGNGRVPDQVVYEKARNLQTGETRTANIPGSGIWACGLTVCYSTEGFGRGTMVKTQLRDGTRSRTAPLGGYVDSAAVPTLDRFIFGSSSTGVSLYDSKTGKIGSVPFVNNAFASQPDPYNRLYPALAKNGYLIVDLAAIP